MSFLRKIKSPIRVTVSGSSELFVNSEQLDVLQKNMLEIQRRIELVREVIDCAPARQTYEYLQGWGDAVMLVEQALDGEAARSAVQQVRDLHIPHLCMLEGEGSVIGHPICGQFGNCITCKTSYPCEIRRSLDGEQE